VSFKVEDGTGLPDATSLAAVATADAYWTDRSDPLEWVAQSNAIKQAALIRASDYIRNQEKYRWLGIRKSQTQRMPWPRTNATERDGIAVPDTIVPWQVSEATCYLAARLVTEDLEPDIQNAGQVASQRVDVIATSFFPGRSAYTLVQPPFDILQIVDGLLAPLLRYRMPLDPVSPNLSLVPTPDAYGDNAFENTR
jgi:hypothetical protein